MGRTVWQRCVDQLQGELSTQQFDACIRPLQARRNNDRLELLAPNRYVRDQVKVTYLARINELLDTQGKPGKPMAADVEIDYIGLAPREPLRADGTGKKKKKNRR